MFTLTADGFCDVLNSPEFAVTKTSVSYIVFVELNVQV